MIKCMRKSRWHLSYHPQFLSLTWNDGSQALLGKSPYTQQQPQLDHKPGVGRVDVKCQILSPPDCKLTVKRLQLKRLIVYLRQLYIQFN